MNRHCVQIELELNVGAEEWTAHCERVVETMRALPGLEWKLWLLDEEKNMAGGIYLFRSAETADAYVHGPVVARLRELPMVKVARIRSSPVAESLSVKTFAVERAMFVAEFPPIARHEDGSMR
jgi:hypothetical protein